ncbi:hypothetical protein pb186bvf_004828 [Paramecium bursaria]
MANYQSAFFNNYDLKDVRFQIDDIRYELDLKSMLWKTDIVIERDDGDNQFEEERKKRLQKAVDIKSIYETNQKQLEDLKIEIGKLDENINKYQEKSTEAENLQAQLTEQYVQEHLETEKVKAQKEKLENLKKELKL